MSETSAAPTMEDMLRFVQELGSGPEPVKPCVSAERFELEVERIFKKCWLNIGRIDDAPEPGSFFTRELPFLKGISILVVRGRDGKLRSFYNVCRHRGTVVERRDCGKAKAFMCPFHGWVYDTAGKLVVVPHEQLYLELEKEQHGLVSIPTDTWADAVFINLDPHPHETLRDYLDDVPQAFQDYPFTTLKRTGRWASNVKANWKLVVDSFKDALHAEFLHRRSLPDVFPVSRMLAQMQNGEAGQYGLRLTGRHSYSTGGFGGTNPDRIPLPTEVIALKGRPVGVMVPEFAADGPTRGKVGGGSIQLFPSCIWLFANDRLMGTHRFFPVAVDETYWEFDTFMEPPANAGEKFSQEYSNVISRDALREDISTLESMQKSFAAGALDGMVMSAIDATMRYNYRVVDSYLRNGKPLKPGLQVAYRD